MSIPLIILLTIILLIVGIFFYIKIKLRRILKEFFDTTSLKEAFEKANQETEETPKSISSMEPVYKNYLKKDFPDANLQELKSMAENCILDVFNAVETKNLKILDKYDGKISSFAETKINDCKDENIVYDNIKIHRTAISKYSHDKVAATLVFTTTLEYFYKVGEKTGKKIQDRLKTELVYVLDKEEYGFTTKSVGVNCPNCGAPVKKLGEKKCTYCGTALGILTKNVWNVNNIIQD